LSQTIASHETAYKRGLLQENLYVGRACKTLGESILEGINRLFKIRLESIDIVFSPRLVDAHLNQSEIKSVPESRRASLEPVKYDTHTAVVDEVTRFLRLGAYTYNKRHEQDK
jgi:hypothetical protein